MATFFTREIPYHARGFGVLRENLRTVRALAREGFTMRPEDARQFASELARAADIPEAEARVWHMVRRALGLRENTATTDGAGS